MDLVRIILFALIITGNQADVFASFWDDIEACIQNPCNCGGGKISHTWNPDNKTIYELSGNTYRYQGLDNVSDLPESWNYGYNIDSDYLCPPFNKSAGRRNNSCLVQFLPPFSLPAAIKSGKMSGENGSLSPFWPNPFNYSVYCAEAARNSSYSKPTIRVRMQNCNAGSCFTQTKVLNGKLGECTVLASPTGLPTTRFCARLAMPRIDDPEGNGDITKLVLNTDPGYYFHFLDTHGFPRPDPGVGVSDEIKDTIADPEVANRLRVFLPKICLYEDPSVYQTAFAWMNPWYRDPSKFDMYDFNPHKMLYHTTIQDTAPSFADAISDSLTRNDVVEKDFFFKPGIYDDFFFPFDPSSVSRFNPSVDGTEIMKNKIDMRWKGGTENDAYRNWVQDFVYNRENSLGCTFMPLAPYPPPFCDKTPPLPVYATIQSICSPEVFFDYTIYDWSIRLKKSTSVDACVQSNVRNNFIYNSARISVDNILPICTSDTQNPYTTDDCVRFYPSSLTGIYINTENQDMIPVCNNLDPSDGTPCVHTRYSNNCIGSNCQNTMRVVYAYQDSATSGQKITYGYPSDTSGVCGGGIYPCASIYGINIGEYSDISIDLSNSANIDSKGYTELGSFSLSNRVNGLASSVVNEKTMTITPYISYNGDQDVISSEDMELEGNSLCMTYAIDGSGGVQGADGGIDCIKRASAPKMSAETCTATNCPHTQNTYLNPQILVSLNYNDLELGDQIFALPTDSVSQVLGLNNLKEGPYGDLSMPYFLILGAQIHTLASDDSFITPPFYGPRALNQGSYSIYGNYQDPSNPINADGTFSSTAKYIEGIEYMQGKYYRGGKWIGAALMPQPKCHQPNNIGGYDDTNCVLVTRNYYDQLDCTTFDNIGILEPCNSHASSQVSCTNLINTISLANGEGNVGFYKCSNNISCYKAPESMTMQVCAASTKPTDRIEPEYQEGGSMHIPSYYDATNEKKTSGVCAVAPESEQLFNSAKCAIRDKTIFEMGAIGSIPQSKCPEEGPATESTGNAVWAESEIGQGAIGTCKNQYSPPEGKSTIDTRLCYMDQDANLHLEPITSGSTCRATTYTCSAINTPTPQTGNAKWSSTSEGGISNATCAPGYITYSSPIDCNNNSQACQTQKADRLASQTRTCSVDEVTEETELSPISDPSKVCISSSAANLKNLVSQCNNNLVKDSMGNPDTINCDWWYKSQKCAAITNPSKDETGNAIWPEAAIDTFSTAQCPDGYKFVLQPGNKNFTKATTRKCITNGNGDVVLEDMWKSGSVCKQRSDNP